jgi:hypothetical protein
LSHTDPNQLGEADGARALRRDEKARRVVNNNG